METYCGERQKSRRRLWSRHPRSLAPSPRSPALQPRQPLFVAADLPSKYEVQYLLLPSASPPSTSLQTLAGREEGGYSRLNQTARVELTGSKPSWLRPSGRREAKPYPDDSRLGPRASLEVTAQARRSEAHREKGRSGSVTGAVGCRCDWKLPAKPTKKKPRERLKFARRNPCGYLRCLHVGKPSCEGGEAPRPVPCRPGSRPPRQPATFRYLVVPPTAGRRRQRPGPSDSVSVVTAGRLRRCRRRRLGRLGRIRAQPPGPARHRAARRRVPGAPICQLAPNGTGMFHRIKNPSASRPPGRTLANGIGRVAWRSSPAPGLGGDSPGDWRRRHHLD